MNPARLAAGDMKLSEGFVCLPRHSRERGMIQTQRAVKSSQMCIPASFAELPITAKREKSRLLSNYLKTFVISLREVFKDIGPLARTSRNRLKDGVYA